MCVQRQHREFWVSTPTQYSYVRHAFLPWDATAEPSSRQRNTNDTFLQFLHGLSRINIQLKIRYLDWKERNCIYCRDGDSGIELANCSLRESSLFVVMKDRIEKVMITIIIVVSRQANKPIVNKWWYYMST